MMCMSVKLIQWVSSEVQYIVEVVLFVSDYRY